MFIEGLGMGCPRSITAAALLAASALAEENPLRLLERWPSLPFAQRIRHLLDDSDLKSLLHDFQLLDVDDDGVLDIADLRVALEGTTGRRNAPRFLRDCGPDCDFDAYVRARNWFDATLNELEAGEHDAREADFLAELEYRVRHASPEDLGHVVGPDGIILDP